MSLFDNRLVHIVNNSTIQWYVGSFKRTETGTHITIPQVIALVNVGETVQVPARLLDGALSVRPCIDNYIWSSNKSEYSFQRLINYEQPQNLLPRCRSSLKAYNHMYCMLHIPILEPISSRTSKPSDSFIYIMTPLSIVNTLAKSCRIIVREVATNSSETRVACSATIQPGEKFSCFTVNLSNELSMEANIERDKVQWSCSNASSIFCPNLDAPLDKSISNIDSNGRYMAISLDYTHSASCYHEVTLFCSYWIQNNSGMRITAGVVGQKSSDTTLLGECEVDVEPVMFDYVDVDRTFMHRVKFKGENLMQTATMSIDKVGVLDLTLENPTHTFHLIAVIEYGKGKYQRTRIVTIRSKYELSNLSTHDIMIKRNGSDSVQILGKEETCSFYWIEPTCHPRLMSVRLGDDEWSAEFGIEDIKNCIFSMKQNNLSELKADTLFLYINTRKQGGTIFIQFQTVTTPPYTIQNYTSLNLTVNQLGTESMTIIPTNSSKSFTWCDMRKARLLMVRLGTTNTNIKYSSIIEIDLLNGVQKMQHQEECLYIESQLKANSRIVRFELRKIASLCPEETESPEIEESFAEGNRHGQGSIISTSLKNEWRVHGEWENGKPKSGERFKLECRDWTYLGPVTLRNTSHQIILSDFLKMGIGELHLTNGDFYYGQFENNCKNGFGVMKTRKQRNYTGCWRNNVYHGYGTLIECDGTIYRGLFEEGQKRGQGTIVWPNGDSLTGEWNGDGVTQGLFKKGTADKCSLSVITRMKHCLEKEWKGQLLDDFVFSPYARPSTQSGHNCHSKQWEFFKREHGMLLQREKEYVVGCVRSQKSELNENFIQLCLLQILSGTHPETKFVSFFLKFFTNVLYGSYFEEMNKKTVSSLLLYNLTDDATGGIKFVYDTIWNYFSESLPNPPQPSQLFKITLTLYIHNLLYSIVFRAYELSFQEKDAIIIRKIRSLSSFNARAFGIPLHHLSFSSDSPPFHRSILIFNELPEKKTIEEKLDVISRTRECIIQELGENINSHINKKKKRDEITTISADDIAPVLTFVLIKSNVRNHCAQANYLFNWKSGFLDPMNPAMTLITSYFGFFDYITELNAANVSKSGLLISQRQLYAHFSRILSDYPKNSLSVISRFLSALISEKSTHLTEYRSFKFSDNSLVNMVKESLPMIHKVFDYIDIGITVTISNSENGEFDTVSVQMDMFYTTEFLSEMCIYVENFIHD